MSSTSRPLIVQKYGGTSVGSAERLMQVAEIVKQTNTMFRPIVVLSAMSGTIKSQGTTTRLLKAVHEVLKPNSRVYLDIVDSLEHTHTETISGAIIQPDNDPNDTIRTIRNDLLADVKQEFDRLRSFMSAAEIIDEISPRSRDVIISSGEKLSARIFTAVLESQGVKAKFFNLDKLIDRHFDPKNINQSFYDYIAERLNKVIYPFVDTHVCVLTGYVGPVPGSLLATIGRGYTDLTAALTAVGLSAQELQIWKEVDGIFTADPRKVPRARKIEFITPEEAAELTYYGSEVIHPFTMEQVIKASIPIRIKNTFKPTGSGTVILPRGKSLHLDPLSDTAPVSCNSPKLQSKLPTAVTIKDDVIALNIHSNRKSVSHGFFAQIFLTLDRFGIAVDLISTSEVHVSMALSSVAVQDNLDMALVELRKHATVDTIYNMAILSLVGKEMRCMVGTASKMFSTLAKYNVNIEMISQGASEINISCLIDERNAEIALRAVHDEVVLGGE
ncbi:hypothetical protein BDV3_001869 [Batrachochytrium dendrobatidis]|uniref:Aspartokinase n=1 Tax=Batrachochytrium dendrobatidis (strain JEL423) TaxID=403673 RepID=A0A177WT59_BATDL|nr:Aspartokinase [Batrachochytrium dendrobatidis]OAJ43006.1 hypothetical protein BDEG_26391 [Batrachochytrium dendrobatidis JEL423]